MLHMNRFPVFFDAKLDQNSDFVSLINNCLVFFLSLFFAMKGPVIKRTRTFGFCRTELELELLSPNPNRTRTELFSNKKILFYPVLSTFNIFMGKNYEKNLRCKFVHRFSRFFPKKVSFSVQL